MVEVVSQIVCVRITRDDLVDFILGVVRPDLTVKEVSFLQIDQFDGETVGDVIDAEIVASLGIGEIPPMPCEVADPAEDWVDESIPIGLETDDGREDLQDRVEDGSKALINLHENGVFDDPGKDDERSLGVVVGKKRHSSHKTYKKIGGVCICDEIVELICGLDVPFCFDDVADLIFKNWHSKIRKSTAISYATGYCIYLEYELGWSRIRENGQLNKPSFFYPPGWDNIPDSQEMVSEEKLKSNPLPVEAERIESSDEDTEEDPEPSEGGSDVDPCLCAAGRVCSVFLESFKKLQGQVELSRLGSMHGLTCDVVDDAIGVLIRENIVFQHTKDVVQVNWKKQARMRELVDLWKKGGM